MSFRNKKKGCQIAKKKEKNLKENKEKWHLLVDKCACWSELRWFADGLRYLNVKGLEAPAGYIHIQRALWACHGGKCALKKKKKKNIQKSHWLVGWLVGAWDEVPHPAVGKASLSVNQ